MLENSMVSHPRPFAHSEYLFSLFVEAPPRYVLNNSFPNCFRLWKQVPIWQLRAYSDLGWTWPTHSCKFWHLDTRFHYSQFWHSTTWLYAYAIVITLPTTIPTNLNRTCAVYRTYVNPWFQPTELAKLSFHQHLNFSARYNPHKTIQPS